MKTQLLVSGLLLFAASLAYSADQSAPSPVIASKFLANISAPGTAAGSVIAAPNREHPNYYFHWTRDGALALDAAIGLWERERSPAEKSRLEKTLFEMIRFAHTTQELTNPSNGPGEPRFLLDGSVDWSAWCRPQSDGPALRAIALSRFVRDLADQGRFEDARSIYDHDSTRSVLKADLEYVAHHWDQNGCDLWEDTYGRFFYNQVVQRRALHVGAEIAKLMDDPFAASFYLEQLPRIEDSLARYWDESRGYLRTTLDWTGGNNRKESNLDASVVLAAIHAAAGSDVLRTRDRLFNPTDDRIQATASALVRAFDELYPINKTKKDHRGRALGIAIGRFPEDTYDGADLTRGNPWFLLIHAMAELKYRAAEIYKQDGEIMITPRNMVFFSTLAGQKRISLRSGENLTPNNPRYMQLIQALIESGDRDLARSTYHSAEDGSMTEQLDRSTGYMRGVPNLTWSYASLLRARWAREAAVLR